MVPFFIYYSMFGMQRVGDLVWAAGDMRARGFMLGATAGRTTLNGEGLQHQDGHSLLLAQTQPHVIAYEPAFAYEIALIVREGLRRMHENNEDVVYYITLQNENYPMLPLPDGCENDVLGGIYKLREAKNALAGAARVDLLGSGSIINEVLRAQDLLRQEFSIAATVWCVTSYGELRREALNCERENLLHPQNAPRVPFVTKALAGASDVFIAASDWMKALPDGLARFLPGKLTVLGTDGFGCSDSRAALRDHFEIDARYIALAALQRLAERGDMELDKIVQAMARWGIDAQKRNPMDPV
jgi:pyruvate dehydrogenase E1 component